MRAVESALPDSKQYKTLKVTSDNVAVLQLNPKFLKRYNDAGEDYQPAFSVYKHDNQLYHLHEDLVSTCTRAHMHT